MKILKNEFWAFIAARKGSKSIKNKNLLKLNSVPLIGISLRSANKNKKIKKVVFSRTLQNILKLQKNLDGIFLTKETKKLQMTRLMILMFLKTLY